MINIGIIGTSEITRNFITTGEKLKKFKLTAIYSRTQKRAHEFGAGFNVSNYFTDLTQFFTSDTFNTVYIASPNDMHFAHVKQAILNHKNVIVEKPTFANPTEMKAIQKLLADYPDVCFFEAARNFHEPNFKIIKKYIEKMPDIQGATLTYKKYSSRYDAFKAGQNPNIFSLAHAAGALQDLGVYLVYEAIGWFGMPQSAKYFPHKLSNGIDGSGIAILNYNDFQVELNVGKTANAYLSSEIYGGKETIEIDNAADMNQVSLIDAKHHQIAIGDPKQNHLESEILDFAHVIENFDDPQCKQKMQTWLEMAVKVNQVLFELRKSADLLFTSDK